eukprot:TRINITY_DN4072_c0_g2_i2.p1 TRINITY_DN4072_c0_g2~~TRINITY_DN4072_c0_g2_i2.p1  ORF type:complete len:451 (+),score=135.18 TRINITY_DN4072_c0_g2_i2:124-1476(+)
MPKKIGKYELGKTLGTGTFSKVKLGIDTDDNSQWAIKIIDKAQLAKEHMEEQLKREIAVMKLLKHANIVQLREVLQTHKHIYLVLELITGGELFDRIVAAKKFDEKTARRYFQQMICGVGFCHAQGIAHRDLKPENLLLDANDILKISDFGLSNLQRGPAGGGGTLLQTVCGTPNYVAPEVLKEKGYNGITADIWSAGVILFVMLAGYLPFDDPNMNALFNKIERGEYRMARHFSDPVKDIISKMLVIEPDKRLTLEGIIAHPWFRIDLDESMFKQGARISVSAGQVSGAVASVGEASGAADRPAKETQGIDAFELMSHLTSGHLDPLTSGATSSAVSVMRHTRAIVSIPAGVGHRDAIKQVMNNDALKGNPKDGKDPAEIKGFCNASKGLMTYVCTVVPFIPTGVGQWAFVELRRGRGDTLDFQGYWEAFTGLLSKGEAGCKLLSAMVH